MITMLLYSHVKQELKLFKDTGLDVSGRLSEEDWDFQAFCQLDKVQKHLEENPILDIALIDVTEKDSVEMACKLRKQSASMYIIILTDISVPPTVYIKPTIMAASLLLRPVSKQVVNDVFVEAINEILKLRDRGDDKSFVIETREGKRLIPYEQILFFESRNKKIFLNTQFEEFSFYDTLDEIESRVGDRFIRSHRSFIVSKTKIRKVTLSQGVVLLKGDYQVPLSRSYKKSFKELCI